ncbi:MAG: bifunctional phosphopantothenoylcysteine decarboxylase/phosphopantothenate--cysteine ligase CoaBC [Nitrospiraceae bacterium]|nr:bifunctional phosphopantothenoylcysteine decarboxylase/phosphopantothenate--cysteine ligase CoaBC [Nitrospiraceae bacterium]
MRSFSAKRVRKSSPLRNKKVLAGITGSVAAYKAVGLIRRLRDEEAEVVPVMTSASLNFITPLSIELAAGRRPVSSLWDEPLSHVDLTRSADLLIIAPATANTIGKMASGIADDLLSAAFLAYAGKKTIIAPAMNSNMYAHPAFKKNLRYLTGELGVIEVCPECGPLACGTEGVGRMADVETILEAARSALAEKDLAGETVLVTAGPTREALDPVRFISNRSSGKMGFALARAALRRGAEVILVSGPASIAPPPGLREYVRVETTLQMRRAVLKHARQSTLLVMSAAPADFTPASPGDKKIEKTKLFDLKLKVTPDILSEVSKVKPRPFLIGFSAETGADVSRAKRKLREKGLDMIVFNNVLEEGAGFDCPTNKVVLIGKDGSAHGLPLMDKEDVADAVFDRFLTFKA